MLTQCSGSTRSPRAAEILCHQAAPAPNGLRPHNPAVQVVTAWRNLISARVMAKRSLLPASPLHPPPLTWEGCGGDGEPGEQQRPSGARLGASGPLLSPSYHEKSQRGAPGSRAAEGVAPSSHRYAVNHTGIIPLPRAAGFAAFPSQSPRAPLLISS